MEPYNLDPRMIAELIPLLYLLVMIFIEWKCNTGLTFLHDAIGKIKNSLNKGELREECKDNNPLCCVFKPIGFGNHFGMEKMDELKSDIFWGPLTNSNIIQSQTAFFEVISFQFLIASFIASINYPDNLIPPVIAFLIFLTFFIGGVIIAYGAKKITSIYTNFLYRTAILIFCLIAAVILLGHDILTLPIIPQITINSVYNI